MSDELENTLIDNALRAEATKQGLIDGDAGLLAKRDSIYVADDGTVHGANFAIGDLIEAKPHLRAKPAELVINLQREPLEPIEDWMRRVGRQHIEKVLKLDPTDKTVGTIGTRRMLDHVYSPPSEEQSSQRKIADYLQHWSR